MRKPVLLIFVNACILILVFGLLGQSLFVVQRVARTRVVSGQVAVQRGGAGAWQPLLAGTVIKSGDVVRTQAGSSAEFSWKNGTRWRLAPNSDLRIDKALLNPNKASETANFRLENGSILVRVVGILNAGSHFEIKTPNAIAAVQGTVFNVAVERGVTQVKVFQGHVDVYDSDRASKISVTPGQKAEVSVAKFAVAPDADTRELDAQPGFARPELSAGARSLGESSALVKGQTETGASVTIDGASVPVLGGGGFLKRLQIAVGKKGWKIESTDTHGAKSQIWQPLPAGYE